MTNFNPLNFIANHAGMNLADAIKEAYEQGKKDAQSERKTGRWEMMPDPYGFFGEIPVCSECGCTTKMRDKPKFCPNCGSYNGGGQDD